MPPARGSKETREGGIECSALAFLERENLLRED